MSANERKKRRGGIGRTLRWHDTRKIEQLVTVIWNIGTRQELALRIFYTTCCILIHLVT